MSHPNPPRDSAPQRDASAVSEHAPPNVHAITEMHLQAGRTLSFHQKAIEFGTARLGRPALLYVTLAVVLLWMLGNLLAPHLGRRAADPPPFDGLQCAMGLAALLISTMVLITQNRQAKLIERRMRLDLQVNLLTEQKTTKLIELIEELRRDLPNVRNRRDSEAEFMQHAAQPLRMIAALEEQTLQAVLEALAPDQAPESEQDAAPVHSPADPVA